MKNIKVSFHHIDFIYRFRIDLLAYNNPNALITVDFQSVYSKFQGIRDTLILTGEQLKMLDALSLTFKKQFIKKYEMAMSERKQKLYPGICIDYLGENAIEHFETIHSKLVEITSAPFSKSQALKLAKELYIYQITINKSTQSIKQQHFQYFCSARLQGAVHQLINNIRKQSWEQTEAYTLYYCLTSFISFIVKNRRPEDAPEMLRIGSVIGAICYKQAKQILRYSMLSEIGTLVYEILFTRLSEQKSVEWIYQVEEENYQVLQIIVQSMGPLNNNIILLDNAVRFIEELRLKISSLNQLLFFITACINSKFIGILQELYERYRLRNFQLKQTLQVGFSDDIGDNFGNKIIRLTKKQISEKKWNKLYREGSNTIIALREKFQQFRAGKVFYNNPNKLSMKESKEKIEEQIQMVQNFQICQSHHAHEEQQLIKNINYHQINQNKQLESKCQILYDDNQQLIKINKWYEQLVNEKSKIIRQLEEAVAQFVNINSKPNKSLSTSHQLYDIKIEPTFKQISEPENTLRPNLLNSVAQTSNQLVNHILPPPPPPPAYLRTSNHSNTRRNSINSHSSQQLKHILPPPPPITMPPELTLPPPPSPLPVFEIQRNSASRVKGSENQKMKQIKAVNWTTVEISRVKDSFWENVTEVQVDENQLLQFFSKKPPEPVNTFLKEKVELKSLLNPARAKNIEIILKKIKIAIPTIPEAIAILNEDILSYNNVESLLKTLPTEKEIEEFNEISVKPSELTDWSFADRYFLTIMDIPNYPETLNGIKFKHDFPEIRRSYQKNIQQFIDFFTRLESDDFLKSFFIEMLSIGNYMNQYNARGTAFGFRFESIERTYHITSQNTNSTLFEYILNSMKKRGLSFPDEASYYKSSFIVPIEVLRSDLKDLRKMCENVQQCLLRSHEEDSRTPQYFLSFYIEVREQISLLQQKFNIAYKTAKEVADFYCEKMQVQKIVKELNQFKGRVKKFIEKNKSSKFIK